MASETPAVVVRDLHVRRGVDLLLHGLNLSVPRGLVVGLIGTSGCGKTTLMRAIIGVQIVQSETVTVLGLLASAFARTEFQVVQFMPLLVFPQILLCGIFLPRDQLPDALQVVSDWLPLSHAVDALRAAATDSQDVAYVAGELLIIGAWIVGAVVLGSITLRRRTS